MRRRNILTRIRKHSWLYAAVTTVFLVSYIYHHMSYHQNYSLPKNLRHNDEKKNRLRYTISVGNCEETPALENASAEYIESYKDRQYLQKETENICSQFPDFSRIENDTLYLTNQKVRDCCVSSITRPWKDRHDDYVLNSTCVPFTNGKIDISELEFLVVTCKARKSSQSPLYNFHAHVPVNSRLKSKIEYWKSQSAERPYSIFLLVIDSTSRAEFFRSLPKTRDILNSMDFVDFHGHHPSGEPTQLNMIPMLMGTDQRTFHREYFNGFNDSHVWDSAPFIWDAFNKLNYLTGYFEDDPDVGTFNYGGQLGFTEQPTTLYTRPLMLCHAKMTKRKRSNYNKTYCFGHRNVIQFLLDYHFKILDLLSEVPTFQVTWPCWPQHDLGGSLRILDDTYSNFFKTVSGNKQILENTLLIVTSDHGFFSTQENEYPVSYNGLVERRNVPLFIRLPDRLRRIYPEMQENLGMNSKLITSHYDIYQTLLHIAKMGGKVDPLTNLTTHGASLLNKLPQTRTCKEARIPKTMCLCQLPKDENRPPSSVDELIIDCKSFDMFD